MAHLRFVMPIEREAYRHAMTVRSRRDFRIPPHDYTPLIRRRMPDELLIGSYPIPQVRKEAVNRYTFNDVEYSCHAYKISTGILDNYVYEQYY